MEKKYVIYWDETYMTSGKEAEVVDTTFFIVLNGFNTEDINAVKSLQYVGDSTPIDNAHVWIMRVK